MGNYKLPKLVLTSIVAVLLYLFIPSSAFAQACTTPGAPSNVTIDYPNCSGQDCNFEQASCSWGAATGATSYSVSVTEVDSGTAVATNQTVTGTTYVFPVTPNKTYKCDVTGTNSCGQAGATGTASLLCQTS